MAQILLIHSNKNVHDLITINLTTYLGAHIIPRATGEEAMALMEILPHGYDVIRATYDRWSNETPRRDL